ncbi:TetR/AcrR family transcriptional regulator [Anaerovorax odorimutans]|uniref:TetR/AcrR family transcriptional regulator n=1 Tax=Anaerovorax odorimutans TaxID=109327 RepID=A0ABT1RTR8_9FIRM|nr:TetR/AcrR family transcriptional regulator [Anaerovorax odorimutans]MCQ4638588.1 TetR/AcrR family transcriptional regulator [Anaerovorax odorimutans]
MNKKEIKSAKTKEKLCNAFIELYKEKPIEKISVKEITDAAGYNRATFYIYYKDIYDVLESIENRLLQFYETNLNNLVEGTLEKISPASFDFLKIITDFYHSNEKEFPILMTKDINFLNSVKKIAKQALLHRQSPVFFNDYGEIEYIIEYQLSAVIGVLNAWIAKKQDISFEKLSALIFQMSKTGVLTTINDKWNG